MPIMPQQYLETGSGYFFYQSTVRNKNKKCRYFKQDSFNQMSTCSYILLAELWALTYCLLNSCQKDAETQHILIHWTAC